jgi:hypothetical protein
VLLSPIYKSFTSFSFKFYFRAGSADRLKGGLVVPFAKYFIHPNYVEATFAYDIAVIKGAIKFSGIYYEEPLRIYFRSHN